MTSCEFQRSFSGIEQMNVKHIDVDVCISLDVYIKKYFAYKKETIPASTSVSVIHI